MRVFLCSYTGFSLAIPMDSVSSIILHKNADYSAIEHDSVNNNTFISLPRLLRSPQDVIRHGIILKCGGNDETSDTEGININKTIILTTEIECETRIPSDNIFPLPKILSGFDLSLFFNGISINSAKTTLFLNSRDLLNNVETKLNSTRRAS